MRGRRRSQGPAAYQSVHLIPLDDAQGNSLGSQNAPYTISVDVVEGFLKVNNTDIQLPLPFSALFSDVA